MWWMSWRAIMCVLVPTFRKVCEELAVVERANERHHIQRIQRGLAPGPFRAFLQGSPGTAFLLGIQGIPGTAFLQGIPGIAFLQGTAFLQGIPGTVFLQGKGVIGTGIRGVVG